MASKAKSRGIFEKGDIASTGDAGLSPPERITNEDIILGQIALRKNAITVDQLAECLKEQKQTHDPLGAIMLNKSFISPEKLAGLLADQQAEVKRRLDSEGLSLLQCRKCRSSFKSPNIDSNMIYRCPECRGLLMRVTNPQSISMSDTRIITESDNEFPEDVRSALTGSGEFIGKYAIISVVGSGGGGVVYRAFDMDLERIVALKVLSTESRVDFDRMKQEGALAARLEFPGIPRVYEAATIPKKGSVGSEFHFIAMEFIDGQTVENTKPTIEQSFKVCRDVAIILDYAHHKGIIHRDVKPSNIMVDKEGKVWLADFGIAKKIVGTTEAALTQTGQLMGTPQFMSPEQASGLHKEVDGRSDIFSLGATMYFLVTGEFPFKGLNVVEILDRIVMKDPVPATTLNRKLPVDAWAIINKAMEKEKGRRYQTAKEMAEDIDRWINGEPVRARPVGVIGGITRRIRRHGRLAMTIVGLLLLAVLTILAGLAYKRLEESREYNRGMERGKELVESQQWADAAHSFEKALKVRPGDGEAQRYKKASEEMQRAVDAMCSVKAIQDRLREIKITKTLPYEPPSVKKKEWDLQDKREHLQREIDENLMTAEESSEEAIANVNELPAAHLMLAELFLLKYDRAEASRDTKLMEMWKTRILKHGGSSFLDRIEGLGTINIRSNTPGAAFYLFRYEERYRRLLPYPCGAAGEPQLIQFPSADPTDTEAAEGEKGISRDGTAYPLTATEYNKVTFPLQIRPGSYLVSIRISGYSDARVPVNLQRRGKIDRPVALMKNGDVPPGFVYIPACPYNFVEDPETSDYTGKLREAVESNLGGFFIQKFSVTTEQYLEFMNDRTYHTLQAAAKHVPHSGRTPYAKTSGDKFVMDTHDEPIMCVSRLDSLEFAKWFGLRLASLNNGKLPDGRPRWEVRLPTEDEWESAARGADGRFFPWGNKFDPSFSSMMDSRPHSGMLDRYGLFPADESPYGVRDMAGLIKNWTSTNVTEDRYVVKGGSYRHPSSWCRSAYRFAMPESTTYQHVGIRLVAACSGDF